MIHINVLLEFFTPSQKIYTHAIQGVHKKYQVCRLSGGQRWGGDGHGLGGDGHGQGGGSGSHVG